MANVKISDLTGAASASGTQEFEVNDSGTSKKVTGTQLATFIEGEVSSSPTLTGQVSLDNGTNTAPSLTNTGDTNTGLYFPSDDTVGLAAGGGLKLSANASGIDVTGTVTADGLTVETGVITIGQESVYDAFINSPESLYINIDSDNTQTGRKFQIGTNATNTSGAKVFTANDNGDISFYEDTGTTPKFFWDASAESLGIGGAPDKLVHLKTSVNNTAVLRIESTATDSYPYLSLKNDAREYQLTAHGPLGDVFTIYDGTAGSHRLVIDSSGNLLVGGTSAGGSSTFTAYADGQIHAYRGTATGRAATFTATTSEVGYFDRLSTDGDIVQFAKNGSTVGSIGASGTFYLASNTASGAGGIRFGNDVSTTLILPSTNAGANKDGDVNLGYSSSRFKDLYLSGGVYLGGVGSANKLDDYEEGNWTPEIYYQNADDQTNSTNNVQIGTYRKIGNVVVANFYLDWSTSDARATDNIGVKNFPFTSQARNSEVRHTGQLICSGTSLGSTESGIMIYLANSSTLALFSLAESGSGNLGAAFGNNSNMKVRATITYLTA